MAEKTSTGALAMVALSPEEEPSIKAYRESQAALLRALEAREKPLFDPTLLAMAQGFLAPTKTGSFGESLGNVASKLAPVQEDEQKRAVEMAQIRAQLASQELQQTRRGQALKSLMGGAESQGSASGRFPSWFAGMTPEKAFQLGLADPDLGKAAMDYLKVKESMVKTQPGGVVTVDQTKPEGFKYTPFGGKTLTERFVPGVGTVKMTEDDAIELDAARKALRVNPEDAAARRAAESIIRSYREPTPVQPSEKPIRGPMTPAEEEAQRKAAEVRATKTAEAEVGRTQEGIGKASDVTSRLGTYSVLYTLASKPGSEKIFGILANPSVSSGIAKLVETGIGLRGFSIGIPEIQNVLRNAGLKESQISDAQLAASLVAEAQLQAARLGQGQGSVSNFERQLFGQSALTMDDRPETIKRKVSMLRARAELERDVAKALRQSKMDIDDFRDTPQYQQMVADYDQKLANVARIVPQTKTGGWRVIR